MLRIILADPPMAHLRGEAATEAPNLGILYLISYVRKKFLVQSFIIWSLF
jgi:hypothetical protein